MSDANTEKSKAQQAALAQIEKQFGKGTIMRLGEGEAIADIQVVSTGSLGLDIALGVGGLPRGRVIEIFGPESSGKTTLALHAIAEAQRDAQLGLTVNADASYAVTLDGATIKLTPTLTSTNNAQAVRVVISDNVTITNAKITGAS